jgi:hypothetical protein
MSANFYAWTRSCKLDPRAKDFEERLYAYYDEGHAPDPALLNFVSALLARFPESGADSPWVDSPLTDDISGDFLNAGVAWKRSDEVWTFFRETAKAHGLICYDPQSEKVYEP